MPAFPFPQESYLPLLFPWSVVLLTAPIHYTLLIYLYLAEGVLPISLCEFQDLGLLSSLCSVAVRTYTLGTV